MTNKELQEELKKYPDDMQIVIGDQIGYIYDIVGVSENEVTTNIKGNITKDFNIVVKFILLGRFKNDN